MTTKKLWILLTFFLLGGWTGCTQSPAPTEKPGAGQAGSPATASATQPVTAKANLAKAKEMAKAWQADAELRGILSPDAELDGTALPKPYAWSYTFYSKKAKKNYIISLWATGLEGMESDPMLGEEFREALPEDFVDSDRAIAAAKAAGFAPPDKTEMSLSKSRGEAAAWSIRGAGESIPEYLVDAQTGQLIRVKK